MNALRYFNFILAIFALTFFIPYIHGAQIECKFEKKTSADSDAACPASRFPLADAYFLNNSHVSGIDTLGSGNWTLCCTEINGNPSSYIRQDPNSCDDSDAVLVRAEKTTNSHAARPDSTWGNMNMCVNSTDTVQTSWNSYPTSGYGTALKLNLETNSHVGAPNESSNYGNNVTITVVPNAPTISVRAVNNDSFEINVTDTSLIEEYVIVYANKTQNPNHIIGTKKSTTQGSTGGLFNMTDSGPDSDDPDASPDATCGEKFCANRSYWIRARFNDSDNEFSPYSNEVRNWTLASWPRINATSILNPDNTLDVNASWSDEDDGNPTDTIYRIEWSDNAGISWNFLCETNNAGGESNPPPQQRWCMHRNLDNDTLYCYRGRGLNGDNIFGQYSAMNCTETEQVFLFGLNVWTDPENGSASSGDFVRTFLFIEHDGNTPDNYTIDYEYEPDKISIQKAPEYAPMRTGPNSFDRFEIDIGIVDVTDPTELTIKVKSKTNASIAGETTYTVLPPEIIGIPGPGWEEIAGAVLLAAAAIIIII